MKPLILICILLLSLTTKAQQTLDVPVEVYTQPNEDACASIEVVKPVSPYLNVRSGPGVHHRKIDQLYTAQKVIVCDVDASENWYGIIYSDNDLKECQVQDEKNSSSYNGRCKSGWVSRDYLEIQAG